MIQDWQYVFWIIVVYQILHCQLELHREQVCQLWRKLSQASQVCQINLLFSLIVNVSFTGMLVLLYGNFLGPSVHVYPMAVKAHHWQNSEMHHPVLQLHKSGPSYLLLNLGMALLWSFWWCLFFVELFLVKIETMKEDICIPNSLYFNIFLLSLLGHCNQLFLISVVSDHLQGRDWSIKCLKWMLKMKWTV